MKAGWDYPPNTDGPDYCEGDEKCGTCYHCADDESSDLLEQMRADAKEVTE